MLPYFVLLVRLSRIRDSPDLEPQNTFRKTCFGFLGPRCHEDELNKTTEICNNCQAAIEMARLSRKKPQKLLPAALQRRETIHSLVATGQIENHGLAFQLEDVVQQ